MAGAPLPNCSVVFFHHVEKTGGTTVRAIFQRHQQLGYFDLISFVGRQNRLQLQLVLHRIDTLIRMPGGLSKLRLAVELHVGGDMTFPYTLYYTLPDLLHIRHKLRAAGCRCHLVSLLRLPLMQELSWHSHFVNQKAPLCIWQGATDCGTRMALGLTCHEVPREPALTQRHESAADGMWRLFDLVGSTEYFNEFVLMLADLVGLPEPSYTAQLVDRNVYTQRRATLRRWAVLRCASLISSTPRGLLAVVERRLNVSVQQGYRLGRPLECFGYGCTVGSSYRGTLDTLREQCNKVGAVELVKRICGRVTIDERVFHSARGRFIAQLRAHAGASASAADDGLGVRFEARLKALAEGNARLAQRARVQQRIIGVRRSESARDSCVGCSGDVVPEFDLRGCWPLWAQFAPDERRFKCSREWTIDPSYSLGSKSRAHTPPVEKQPLACWRTCWTPMGAGSDGYAEDERHCTAPCPAKASGLLPRVWRAEWDQSLQEWKRGSEDGRAFAKLAALFSADALTGRMRGWHQRYLTQHIMRVF